MIDMAQSTYNSCTVNAQYWQSNEENWETQKPYIQSNYDQRSVAYQYQQPMPRYHGGNMNYFGNNSLTYKDNTGRKYLSHSYNGNNQSIASGGILRVPRPRPAQPAAVPRSSPRSRLPALRFRPPSPRSQPSLPTSRLPTPRFRPPSPRSRTTSPGSRSPSPGSRSPSLRCRPQSQQTPIMPDPSAFTYQSQQTPIMPDPSAFTYHQFQTQYGDQMKTYNPPRQQYYYPEGGYSARKALINGIQQMSAEYYIQGKKNEKGHVSTPTYTPTEKHNQNSVEYFQQDQKNKKVPSTQSTFPPIEEVSQTKSKNDNSSIKLPTGSWHGQLKSKRVIRSGQYRMALYSATSVATPTNIGQRSSGQTSEKENNRHIPIYGPVTPLPSNVHMVPYYDSNESTYPSRGQRSREQSPEMRGNRHMSKFGIVTPLPLASYLEDVTTGSFNPAMSPDSDYMVVMPTSTWGGTAGANMRLKYDRFLPEHQIPKQWSRPVKQSGHMVKRTHPTSWRKQSGLTNDPRSSCQEPNEISTGRPPTSTGDQHVMTAAEKTFTSNFAEQFHYSENAIFKTPVTDKIPIEIATLSELSDPACGRQRSTEEKGWRPKHLQTEETIHLLNGMTAEVNTNNSTGIIDSPRLDESKDGPQKNQTIAALIDRLLKEARTACDLIQQQGQWQQENTTGRIRTKKSKGRRPDYAGLFDTCGTNSAINDKKNSFSSTSRRLYSKPVRETKEIVVAKEIRLPMSDLKICDDIVAPVKEPASSGTWPPITKDLDVKRQEVTSNTKTYTKKESERCVKRAKRRLSSNSLSFSMNHSKGCEDGTKRSVSSEEWPSTLSESKGYMKRGIRVSRQEEDGDEQQENSPVSGAKKARTIVSELSTSTKRACTSLSEGNITKAKSSSHEGEIATSLSNENTRKEKNFIPEETSKKREVDTNENDIKSSCSNLEHEGPASSKNEVLESEEKRKKKEVDEDNIPKLSCFSQEHVRSSHSRHESRNKSFPSKDNGIKVIDTKRVKAEEETRKLASEENIPDHAERKTSNNDEDKDEPNPLYFRQEPEIPSSSRQRFGNILGTLLLASVKSADISAIKSVWTQEKENGPERVRNSNSVRKTRNRHTIVNELKLVKSDSLSELFKLLRI